MDISVLSILNIRKNNNGNVLSFELSSYFCLTLLSNLIGIKNGK